MPKLMKRGRDIGSHDLGYQDTSLKMYGPDKKERERMLSFLHGSGVGHSPKAWKGARKRRYYKAAVRAATPWQWAEDLEEQQMNDFLLYCEDCDTAFELDEAQLFEDDEGNEAIECPGCGEIYEDAEGYDVDELLEREEKVKPRIQARRERSLERKLRGWHGRQLTRMKRMERFIHKPWKGGRPAPFTISGG